MADAPQSLIDILVRDQKINPDIAHAIKEEAREESAREELLFSRGLVTEEDLSRAKARLFQLPIWDGASVAKISEDALEEIPPEAAAHYQILPVAKEKTALTVGMVNPGDLRAREAIKFLAARGGLSPKIVVITPSAFSRFFNQYRSIKGEVTAALEELEEELEGDQVKLDREPESQKIEEASERIATEAPITKIVAVILKHAIEGSASDVHIEPTFDQVRVRFRVDGVLHTSLYLPKHVNAAVVARTKILSNLKIDETRIPQDGRFRAAISGRDIDFRVSTFPTTLGEKVEMRVLDPERAMHNLDELGLHSSTKALIENAIAQPFGMVLLTGPTGSGKSTTLYGILQQLPREKLNIISLEDPVEYQIEGVSQSQIRPDIDYTFASGLRHILRQDPDVIMVGEIRDEETAQLAVHAALTGHLVFSTLHTNNAVGVIPRLIDMKVETFLVSSAIRLAMAQRLVRKLCSYCKEKREAAGRVKELIEKTLARLPTEVRKEIPQHEKLYVYVPRGCARCAHKGTRGRIAIFEALSMTPQLNHIILTDPSEETIEEEARRQGMVSMFQDGVLKALGGLVSLEEVMETVEVEMA
ncbi:MAG: type II/IV secretion system protein [Parcubacteria group bacterium]|nr:type II/IV secretion system protein [Parcubacteria group bacterium]